MSPIFDFFLGPYRDKETFIIIIEAIVFVTGILSVWYAKKENIWVYPTGLVATVLTVYLLYRDRLLGDMMMNFYFSVMSVYGWWNWARTKNDKKIVQISRTNAREKSIGFGLFLLTMVVTYIVYRIFDVEVGPSNYIDIITSGIFFTGMWYMALKKLENWTLWILADVITVPLYAYRGWGMLSLQYLIFTILAIQGYFEWKKSIDNNLQAS
ncbi:MULTISPECIES: nicotinamide riboside transporter PnuC [Maribacter]|uniref:Nicotinamide riboside transporter PnuC n=1 Tax=Maribacter flavus TaxID=1658664 RepID=A0ABU7IG88_9FLAO|nr:MULTISPECIES: nicotinamide riboside transporter PnuC [Maribacter]MDC6404497.1 nicotinamide riboside transporter PnuC [Maribacter sp. PR66]MEE1971641.1 nicotinamide riboside transporter PnuC [Maribacter flavus]